MLFSNLASMDTTSQKTIFAFLWMENSVSYSWFVAFVNAKDRLQNQSYIWIFGCPGVGSLLPLVTSPSWLYSRVNCVTRKVKQVTRIQNPYQASQLWQPNFKIIEGKGNGRGDGDHRKQEHYALELYKSEGQRECGGSRERETRQRPINISCLWTSVPLVIRPVLTPSVLHWFSKFGVGLELHDRLFWVSSLQAADCGTASHNISFYIYLYISDWFCFSEEPWLIQSPFTVCRTSVGCPELFKEIEDSAIISSLPFTSQYFSYQESLLVFTFLASTYSLVFSDLTSVCATAWKLPVPRSSTTPFLLTAKDSSEGLGQQYLVPWLLLKFSPFLHSLTLPARFSDHLVFLLFNFLC